MNGTRTPLLFAQLGMPGGTYVKEVIEYRTRKLNNGRMQRLARVRTQSGAVLDVIISQLIIRNKY